MRNQGELESAFKPITLVELLRHRAIHYPLDLAYTFIADEQELRINHKQLDQSARILALRLQEKAKPGERVLLLYPSGLDFIKAFFALLVRRPDRRSIAATVGNRPMPRLKTVLVDAQPRLILTLNNLLDGVKSHFTGLGVEPECLTADDIGDETPVTWRPRDVAPDTIAVLQYTSGSTNTPKGVVLTHGNLIHNLSVIEREFTDDRLPAAGVTWLPNYHDMGLIGGILSPLYIGGPQVIMSPAAFVNRPYRWLEAITRFRATISGAPNFAYELCVSKITQEQKATLDLSRWLLAFCGAEPIRYETVRRFTEAFVPCGFSPEAFYPCYGLAEATLLVSGSSTRTLPTLLNVDKSTLELGRAKPDSVEGPNTRVLVSSGKVFAGQNVVIVEPESSVPCPPGTIGEVWLSGPSIAQGYWQQPEETRRSFHAHLNGTGVGPFFRTGDLGFISERDQELYITGRLKDLIIVGGRNIYPQDIETQVENCHPELGQGFAAAFSLTDDDTGEERLVVVREIGRHVARKVNFSDVIRTFRRAIAEGFDLQLYALVFVRELTIPKTSSGKIQRFLCKKAYLEGTLAMVEQWRLTEPAHSSTSGNDNNRTAGKVEKSRSEIETWLISHLCRELRLQAGDIDPEQPFGNFGINSIKAMGLAAELETWLGRPLPPTLAYDYPNIRALSNYLTGQEEARLPSMRSTSPAISGEPIAIVGIGCRFPGCDGPDAFWNVLVTGADCVTEASAARRDENTAGEKNGLYGGFLKNVDEFDAGFFEISAREATLMDPQQRLMLEMCWEAMEDARQTPEKLEGTRTGVFVGASNNDYGRVQFSDPSLSDPYAGTGNALSVIANRISYNFGLRGPSLTVDTACSSSLVAIHLACQSIRNGECDAALVGGVNLILSPTITINFRDAGLMASDGRCKAFDSRADGYVRGEGAAMVLIKPLSKARADGDRIYALIKATATNQDGKTNGLTAPSYQAQKDVLLQAYRQAGVSPARVQYIEAHGTGTKLGDPIEARALGETVGLDRAAGDCCAVGSVKTNIGHLEAAAGVAGLIKTALALKNRAIPPSLHLRNQTPTSHSTSSTCAYRRISGPGLRRRCRCWRGSARSDSEGRTRMWCWKRRRKQEGRKNGGRRGGDAHIAAVGPQRAGAEGPGQELCGVLEDITGAARFDLLQREREAQPSPAPGGGDREGRSGTDRGAGAVDGRAGAETAVETTTRRPLVFVFTGQGAPWQQMAGILQDEPVYQQTLRALR
jgi:acyl-CoA synthetase (AMP-forming)/AMP-acid ligase II/3-oxoacyl-(acyl-carrier-protein) synthase/acyl carrier protein